VESRCGFTIETDWQPTKRRNLDEDARKTIGASRVAVRISLAATIFIQIFPHKFPQRPSG
jgi:hypothetical protein